MSEEKICKKCGKKLEKGYKICPYCGVKTETKIEEETSKENVCSSCGNSISSKNGIVCLLLLLFLGGFGGHLFYVGKIGSAIIRLILLFIMYITLFLHIVSRTEYIIGSYSSNENGLSLILLFLFFATIVILANMVDKRFNIDCER